MSCAHPRPLPGFKRALPTKPCAVCGRPMSWRRKWARTWEAVKYCSDACRRRKPESGSGADG
ncbi:DUF2256 domain-containing protein [Oryzomicrobium sp.]|uniref:DUF2256 domain-containing protein n=1 Tax=Oryzomicrobium sp. TaxID=1911578 RepID=UPI002FE3CFEF